MWLVDLFDLCEENRWRGHKEDDKEAKDEESKSSKEEKSSISSHVLP